MTKTINQPHSAGSDNAGLLQQAILLHQNGRLSDAALFYAKVLDGDPTNIHALRLAGLILIQSGDARMGLAQVERAAALAPEMAEVQSNLGTAYMAVGRINEAVIAFQRCAEIKPENAEAFSNLGAALLKAKKNDEALSALSAAVRLAPENPMALKNLGNVHFARADYDQAATSFAAAIHHAPEMVDAYFNLGTCFLHLDRAEDAKQALKAAARLAPKRSDIQYNLAAAYKRMDDLKLALMAYQDCLAADPGFVQGWVDYARALEKAGLGDDALAAFRHAVALDPKNMDALDNLGQAASRHGLFTESLGIIEQALALDPYRAETHNNFGVVQQMMGDVTAAIDSFSKSLKCDPTKQFAEKNLLFAVLNQHELTNDTLWEIHHEHGQRHSGPINSGLFDHRDRAPDRRLRVGYLSSDFHDHPVGRNIISLIANHDPNEVEIHLYAHAEKIDETSGYFRELADRWNVVTDLNDAQLADKIRHDEIDILVTTAGRFNENRRFVAPYRAAPVQVSYHDCATTGLDAMDYWLTDKLLHPTETTERFTEKLEYVPVFYQFPAPVDFPAQADVPCLTSGSVTFGSFSKPEKINDTVIELWAQVLDAVPNSRLRLKYHSFFREDSYRSTWIEKFTRHGIEASRLDLRPTADQRHGHLAQYNEIDIALDPFPFNGVTTTFEALAMGVPVVTLEGNRFVNRAASSILRHAGLEEMVAADTNAYIAIAKTLADDPARLSHYRSKLRPTLINAPLCDGQTYARNIETAFRRMWRRWCAA